MSMPIWFQYDFHENEIISNKIRQKVNFSSVSKKRYICFTSDSRESLSKYECFGFKTKYFMKTKAKNSPQGRLCRRM